MSDLATLASTPREVPLSCGESVHVAPLNLREWAVLQQWIKDKVPSPLVVARDNIKGVDLPREDRQAILASAAAIPWPPRPGTPGWIDAINRADDQKAASVAFLAAVLRNLADAERLADKVNGEDFANLCTAAFGAEPADPKA
jgi:hypothetical protein